MHSKLKLASSPAPVLKKSRPQSTFYKVTREDVWPVSTDDQTVQVHEGAGEDDFIYLPSGPEGVACERPEERSSCSHDGSGGGGDVGDDDDDDNDEVHAVMMVVVVVVMLVMMMMMTTTKFMQS